MVRYGATCRRATDRPGIVPPASLLVAPPPVFEMGAAALPQAEVRPYKARARVHRDAREGRLGRDDPFATLPRLAPRKGRARPIGTWTPMPTVPYEASSRVSGHEAAPPPKGMGSAHGIPRGARFPRGLRLYEEVGRDRLADRDRPCQAPAMLVTNLVRAYRNRCGCRESAPILRPRGSSGYSHEQRDHEDLAEPCKRAHNSNVHDAATPRVTAPNVSDATLALGTFRREKRPGDAAHDTSPARVLQAGTPPSDPATALGETSHAGDSA